MKATGRATETRASPLHATFQSQSHGAISGYRSHSGTESGAKRCDGKERGEGGKKKRINKYVHNSQYVCVSVCVCVCILWQMCATFTAVGRSRRRGIALSLALSPKGRIERRVVCVILSQSSCQL